MKEYPIHIDTCDGVTIDAAKAHAATWPFPRDCQHHTPDSWGYIQKQEWFRLMDLAGYSQITCQVCGRWEIWLPKSIAVAIRRAEEKETREFCRRYQRFFEERLKP